VNRAHPGLNPKDIADGILAFQEHSRALGKDSRARHTKLFLEILLVAGVNDSERNLELLAAFCNRLQPDRVDVVTLSRPGTEALARAVDPATLARWRERLAGQANLAAQAGERDNTRERAEGTVGSRLAQREKNGHKQNGSVQPEELRARLLASLARRPQTGAQLAEALLADQGAVSTVLAELLGAGRIAVRQQDGQDYYQARTE